MKYNTPELTASVPAINAIQTGGSKFRQTHPDSPKDPDENPAYEDWE